MVIVMMMIIMMKTEETLYDQETVMSFVQYLIFIITL